MPSFRCTLSDASGRIRKIIRFADSENDAVRSFAGGTDCLVSIERTSKGEKAVGGERRNSAAVLEFTEMIGMLVESGLSLKDSLELVGAMRGEGPLKYLSARLSADVSRGVPFPKAVEQAGDAFPAIYRGMVRIGDRVGSVEKIFQRLAAYLRERKALKEKTSAALAYPLLVLALSVVGTFAIAVFLLPRMETIFLGFGGEAAEKIRGNVRTISRLASFLAVAAAAGLGGLLSILAARSRSPAFTVRFDRLMLRVPYVGTFLSALGTLNFSFAMETLVSGGVPIELAIGEAAAVVENAAYRAALLRARDKVMRGVPISAAFAEQASLPAYMSRWLAAGERSGRSDRVFTQIRNYFKGEVERSMQRYMALIEPILIIAVGLIVLAIVLLLIVPLFSMYGTIL